MFTATAIATLVTVLLEYTHARIIPRDNAPGSPDSFTPEAPIKRSIPGVNFPDPFLYQSSGTWYAFGTGAGAGILNAPPDSSAGSDSELNVLLATSTDLTNWEMSSESGAQVLPNAGSWSISKPQVWAPALYEQSGGNGDLLIYYSAISSQNTNHHCVGVASTAASSGPQGPFSPASSSPLVCPLAQGGAIDAVTFADGSSDKQDLYIVYKIDGNSQGHGGECQNTVQPQVPTPILLQPLASNGLQTAGDPIQLLDHDSDDGPLIEAPMLVKSDQGTYFLFFSSGCTFNNDYTVKYATADNVKGPYTRAASPLLASGSFGGLVAPGSVGVAKNGDKWALAFAARVQSQRGTIRELFMAGLQLQGTHATLVDL